MSLQFTCLRTGKNSNYVFKKCWSFKMGELWKIPSSWWDFS